MALALLSVLRRKRRGQAAAAAIVVGIPLLHASASAQSIPYEGFALDRFNPSRGGSDWFANESLNFEGNLRPSVGLVEGFASRPLVLSRTTGETITPIIDTEFVTHVVASIRILDRIRVGVSLPVALMQSGTEVSTTAVSYPAPRGEAVGDLRASLDTVVVQIKREVRLAFGLDVFLPTGASDGYVGEGIARVAPHLMVAGEVDRFAYAASASYTTRRTIDSEELGGVHLGPEVLASAAVGFRATPKILVGPEIFASTVARSEGFFGASSTPVEGLIGGHAKVEDDWRIGAGVSHGFTSGIGSPLNRAILSVEWMPGSVPREPEPAPQPQWVAPPPPPEPPPPVAVVEPLPVSDRDLDGVPDTEDACPDAAGIRSQDPKTNGCPNPDRDGDGIPNEEDACPDEPGKRDANPKKNGCPAAYVQGKVITITEQVKFRLGSAVIMLDQDTEAVLSGVLGIMNGHPEIEKVRIDGYTDNQGKVPYNKELSGRRAAAVVNWLVTRGIDTKRLISIGHGVDDPIDDNATEAGRRNNRRVEFHIEDSKP